MKTKKLRLRHLLCFGLCFVMMGGFHALAASTYSTGSVEGNVARVVGSARMEASSSSSKDFCVATGALGGSNKEGATGSVSGKVQGIDVKTITIDKGSLNAKKYTYTWSKTVKDDYSVMTVVLKLDGVGSKTIYASH